MLHNFRISHERQKLWNFLTSTRHHNSMNFNSYVPFHFYGFLGEQQCYVDSQETMSWRGNILCSYRHRAISIITGDHGNFNTYDMPNFFLPLNAATPYIPFDPKRYHICQFCEFLKWTKPHNAHVTTLVYRREASTRGRKGWMWHSLYLRSFNLS